MRGILVVLALVAALFPLQAASANTCRITSVAVACVGNDDGGIPKDQCRPSDSGERFSGVRVQTHFGTPVIDEGSYKVGGATRCQGTAHVTYVGATWNTGSGISAGGLTWIEGPTCQYQISVGAGIRTVVLGEPCVAGAPPDLGWGYLPGLP